MNRHMKLSKKAASVISLIAVILVFTLAAYFQYEREVEEQKRDFLEKVNTISAKIEGDISSYFYYAYAAKSILSVEPDYSMKKLDSFFSSLPSFHSDSFRSFTVIKDTNIEYIYPQKGNESALGTNIALIPAQKEAVEIVKRTGLPTITAPVDLVQGGRAIIIRVPVDAYIDSNMSKSYWGQVSVVLQFDRVFEKAGLMDFVKENDIRITNMSLPADSGKRVVYESTNSAFDSPVVSKMNLMDIEWGVESAPKSGWGNISVVVVSIMAAGLILSVLAYYFVYDLMKFNESLNEKVVERTEQLQESLAKLKDTQEMLVEEKKNALLGQLVSGVAHEINTPLGVGITALSYIDKSCGDLARELAKAEMAPRVKGHLESIGEAMGLCSRNLNSVAKLVSDFKLVSTDLNRESKRRVTVKSFLELIGSSGARPFKDSIGNVNVTGRDDLTISTYTGALSQIISTFLSNSAIHGYNGVDKVSVDIGFSYVNSILTLWYSDDGVGMSDEALSKVFQPFFTTKRSAGCVGLGLHIVSNIVHQVLKGDIKVDSSPMKGVKFTISIPVERD
jgi:sensor domain CHASE-containing protein/two-component sensor histidine kinase